MNTRLVKGSAFFSFIAALGLALLSGGQSWAGATWPERAAGSTRTVTSTADAGAGTLRQALIEAVSGDTILFSPAVFLPGSPAAIALQSGLPAVTQDSLTIDAGDAGVILDGASASGDMTPGLLVQGSGAIVRGLQIVNFSGCGIELGGQNATVGGDREIGAGPLGQGNLVSGNKHGGVCIFDGGSGNTVAGNLIGVDVTGMSAWLSQGDGVHINGGHDNVIEDNVVASEAASGIKLCCSPNSAYNTVRDNRVGVAIDGQTPLYILDRGIGVADGANHNTIGPGNILNGKGIWITGGLSPGNTILGNSIHNNPENSIWLWNENMDLVRPPAIAAFDLAGGVVSGVACPNCLVQVYSDEDNEGRLFEGQTTAGAAGEFTFAKGSPLDGPHLTATATDITGTTSMFSVPTSGAASVPLQVGNATRFESLSVQRADQLPDNRLGAYVQDQSWVDGGIADATVLDRLGVKRARGSMNDPDRYNINWDTDENEIHASFDGMITGLDQHGIPFTYILLFWDKEHYRETGQMPLPRFQSEEEIQRYLDFVRLMVQVFGDRVDDYELWNEPGWDPTCLNPPSEQCIPLATYISMGKRAIAVIREEDPGARIVVPSYHAWEPELYRNYLIPILESDLMPLVDVIAWHPFIVHLDPEECGGEFFDRYWETVLPEIKSTATAHGFVGEYRVDELSFPTRTPSSTGPCAVFDRTSGKYFVREIVHHLGEDVAAGIHGMDGARLPVLQRLATLMAGAVPSPFPVPVSTPADAMVYTFLLPDGDRLVAIWRHVDITEEDQDAAVPVTILLPGFIGHKAYVIDVLSGVQQGLDASTEGTNLVVRDLLVRDYPLFVRLTPHHQRYLPLVVRQ
jgi:Right handed beta helix region